MPRRSRRRPHRKSFEKLCDELSQVSGFFSHEIRVLSYDEVADELRQFRDLNAQIREISKEIRCVQWNKNVLDH